jgi:hypothetical protein
MATEPIDPIEVFWEDLLSGEPERIRYAFFALQVSEQESVYTHLKRMVNESGWQPEQKASAQNALKVIDSFRTN